MRKSEGNGTDDDGAPDGQVASERWEEEAAEHDLFPDGSAHGDHDGVQERGDWVPGHNRLLHVGRVKRSRKREDVEVQLRETVHEWEHEAA